MKNLRPTATSLLVPLTLLVLSGNAVADLALDTGFGTDGIVQVDIAAGSDTARDVAAQADGALVLVGRSRQANGPDTIGYVTLTRLDPATGAVDEGFGTDGIVNFLPGVTAQDGGGGLGEAVAIQPADQKILVTGLWTDSAAAASEAFVARLLPSGELDPDFGTDGVVLLAPAGLATAAGLAVAVRDDGSIIVAGTATEGDADVGFVMALDDEGDALPGFDTAIVQNPLEDGASFRFNALVILADDGILAGGGGGDLALVRFDADGALDGDFGTDGIASFNYQSFDTAEDPLQTFEILSDIAVLGDGRIVFTGRTAIDSSFSASNWILGRATAAGELDDSFGSGGYAPLPDDLVQEAPEALGVRPSGDLVIVGFGMPPTQVSANGIAVESVTGEPALATTGLAGVQVLPDGDVIAVGLGTVSGANTAFVAARFDASDLADGPDTVPDPFVFATQTGLEPGTTATSEAVTIGGLGASAVVVAGGGASYSVGCTDSFTTLDGTVSDGDTICVRAQTAATDLSPATVLISIGGAVGHFTAITGDATPDAFTFENQTDVTPGTQVTSAPITLAGLTTRTTVRVSGAGAFSVGCTDDYTTQATKADPGAQVCVRHTSAAGAGVDTSTVLEVGEATTVSGTFTSTTAGDSTPDAFDFTDQEDVATSTVVTSAPVTLAGFTSSAPVSVTGGQYSIGCTASYTSAAGTVAPGATVCVRHTSAPSGGTQRTTTLTVGPGGGVSGTFTSTTAGAQDTTPDPFSFASQSNVPLGTVITSGVVSIGGFDSNAAISVTGGTYSVGCNEASFTSAMGSLPPNTSVCVRHTSALTGGTATNTALTVGGVSATFTSTTLAGNADPADFSFVDQTGVAQDEVITSAPVTITGIDIASPVSVTGGEYSIGCTSNYTTSPGNISNGGTVCVRHRSAFDANASTATTLQVGTKTGTFTSTTGVSDQTPDAFTFESQANLALSTLVISNEVAVEGIDGPVRISLSGPTRVINTPFGPQILNDFGLAADCDENVDFNASGTIFRNGDTFCVAVLTPAADLSSAVVTVTLGGSAPGTQETATFTVTTGDTVPDAFSFTDQVGVPMNAIVRADPITITGITAPSLVRLSGSGEYQVDCTGPFTRAPGLVENDQTICVRQVAPGSLGTLTSTVLTIGGVSATFSSTTTTESKPLPGGSAIDLWSLLLLAPLAALLRARPEIDVARERAPTVSRRGTSCTCCRYRRRRGRCDPASAPRAGTGRRAGRGDHGRDRDRSPARGRASSRARPRSRRRAYAAWSRISRTAATKRASSGSPTGRLLSSSHRECARCSSTRRPSLPFHTRRWRSPFRPKPMSQLPYAPAAAT